MRLASVSLLGLLINAALAGPAVVARQTLGAPTPVSPAQFSALFATAIDYVAAATCLTNTTFACGSALPHCDRAEFVRPLAIASRRPSLSNTSEIRPLRHTVRRRAALAANLSGYVAYNTKRKLIIVSHCGTNFQSVMSIANDAEAAPVPPDSSLQTPTMPVDALVHSGFQATWLRSRDAVLEGVQTALKRNPRYTVLVGTS